MAALGTTFVLKWLDSWLLRKSATNSSGLQSGFPLMSMSFRMPYQGGGTPSIMIFSTMNAVVSTSPLKRLSYSQNILILSTTWTRKLGSFRQKLKFHARLFQRHAWAARTCKSLNSEKKAFTEFCLLADIQSLPVTGEDLCLYAVWLWITRRLKAPKSVRNYLSAVSTMHRRLDLPCHTASTYGPLGQLLSGLTRLARHTPRKALPITPIILANLLDSVSLTPSCPIQQFTLTTFKSLTLLMFLTMSRSSNMVPESRKKFDAEYLLKWENIQRVDDGIIITITKSKTNQFATNHHLIPLALSDDKKFCPVEALTRLSTMYGPEYLKSSNPVFLIPAPDGSFVPLKKSEYVAWLKKRLTQMGLPAEKYGMHSFRHGSVQQAILHEDNRILVQLASGHSSDAILGYAHVPPERRFRLSQKIVASLANL